MALLGNQLVDCNRTVKLEQYRSHVQSAFFERSTHSPSRTTIQDILEKTTGPTTPAEKEVAQHFVRRLMAENVDGQLLQLPTQGQVLMWMYF